MSTYYVKPKSAWKASRDPKDIEEKYAPSAINVNRYIKAFMMTDATHMLMVDADMEIPAHSLDELLKLDVDIASGVSVGHATAEMSTVVKWFPKPRPKSHRSKPYWRFLSAGEVFGNMFYSPPERLRTGAFCMLTKRRVFEKHHPKLSPLKFRWNPPQRWGIDLTFWEDARRWGFTSAIHGGIVCGHLPQFPLKTLESIEWT